jgi:hypothetical protein
MQHPLAKPARSDQRDSLPATQKQQGLDSPPPIFLIWSGTTGGENCVVGYARDLTDALNSMARLAPQVSASHDEIRRDWPCPGVTEILRTWFDPEARVSRWLRATPTFHALAKHDGHLRLNARSANPSI